MKFRIVLTIIYLLFIGNCTFAKVVHNPKAVSAMLERIGGTGASKLISTELNTDLAGESFVISAADNKPHIKASTLSALTCGIGWYLNHYANINLSWNCPSVDLGKASLPLPKAEDSHTCSVDYRYYLNYCTFSYSMSTWTWDRWQQEIDWMALHGVNMPLQIVGLETVWRNLLREEYGYTDAEVNNFVAGPCFMAWFGMNNLEGWGGPNPQWWYERQEQLCRKINERMHSLGIEPVLPGYSGMIPGDFSKKTGIASIDQGKWCSFNRPHILDPNIAQFGDVATKYYKHLHRVMGESKYYSMDPFHEGANTSQIDVDAAYANIYKQMAKANKQAKWVIQQWQWSRDQYKVLSNVPKGKLIVLDLYSDGRPNLKAYGEHDVVYCILPNFGGRTGIMGRFDKAINEFCAAKQSLNTLRGIGAAPESIEQVPVLYDALFELPWMSEKPDPAKWMEDYTVRRYGSHSAKAIEAWQLMRTTVLNCPTALQGPHEAVTCARPSWHVDRVSTWGGTRLFYDASATAKAASLLLEANLSGPNYAHDLVDFTRQALTDYANTLLKDIDAAHKNEDKEQLDKLEKQFIDIINDLDVLLSTDHDFMLGKWVNMARNIADEVPGTTAADKDWLQENALTLITTWGERENSDNSGLHDYSYRQWAGMLKQFYGMRWQKFFAAAVNGDTLDWYEIEREWTLSGNKNIADTPHGDAKQIATTLMHRYFKSN
jgi:alpha-N-acetylglucosaminidase